MLTYPRLKELRLIGYANDSEQVWTGPVTSPIDLLTQQILFLFLECDVILPLRIA